MQCMCVCVSALHLRLLQAQGVHPPAVADGVEESTAAGGAGIAARRIRGAAFHQAAAAAGRSHHLFLEGHQ